MKPIINFSCFNDIVSRNLRVYKGKVGSLDGVKGLNGKEVLNLTLLDIAQGILDKELYYEDDPDGANTLVIKKFKDIEEMKNFVLTADFVEMEKELKEKYGPNSGYADPETLEFCITLHRQKE